MREFAEFVKCAGGGIALEGVHRAANAPNAFFVRGILLEIEACVIQGLQQLVGGLEKKRAQLRIAILGDSAHVFTSSRWYAVPLFSCTMRNFCVRPTRLSPSPPTT